MKIWRLFFSCMILGGALAMGGSILGNAFGKTGLYVGGVVGGILGSIAAARLSAARGWIPTNAWPGAATGAAVGFLAAAFFATRTLSSPVGPVLSTTLIGIGAIMGARMARGQSV